MAVCHRRFSLLVLGVFSLLCLVGCGGESESIESGSSIVPANAADPKTPQRATVSDVVITVKQAVRGNQLEQASKGVQDGLVVHPDSPELLELAGDIAGLRGEPANAAQFYQSAIDAQTSPSAELLDKPGRQWMNAGRPFDAVDALSQAIKHHPESADFRQKAVGLMASLGLQWEAKEHIQWLVQRGHGSVPMLTIISDLTRPQTDAATCDYALKHYPADQRPQYSLARLEAQDGRWQQVAKRLKSVVAKHPEFVPAQIFYGRALVESGDSQAVIDWASDVPGEVADHPEYWLAAGIWASRNDRPDQAARAFWKAVTLDANHPEALSRLAQSLSDAEIPEGKQPISTRAAKLARLRGDIDAFHTRGGQSQKDAMNVAATLNDLGRTWESVAWLIQAFAMRGEIAPTLQDQFKHQRDALTGTTPWEATGAIAGLDLSQLPAFRWESGMQDSPNHGSTVADASVIRFEEEAKTRGLNHTCRVTTATKKEAGLFVYQSGSSGGAVIDYDLDGWPDLYLTNMDGAPLEQTSTTNHLYRNVAGRFVKTTTPANAIDKGFAQGVSVGDYDSDGFDDLLVMNIGRASLLRNNGDGTFSDATHSVGLSANGWFTSGVIADINGDGFADLYLTAYVDDQRAFKQPCIDEELGEPRSCMPTLFNAMRDQVWQGDAEGNFENVSNQWLKTHQPGRGFGVIAGQMNDQPGLELFVANDMTANHFWARDDDSPTFRLVEQGTVRGIAYNERSIAQASMGIAAGDADGDNAIDFYVTHFADDHNTFYRNSGRNTWVDKTASVGLRDISIPLLGWGCQWIDADNDGQLELMVSNGDVDDFQHQGREFRQPAQLFSRSGNRWSVIDDEQLGGYFQQSHVGRAVMRLDVNCDGLTDMLVTRLFDPVALLVNQTQTQDRSVRLFLRSTTGHRSAVGATVRVHAKGRQHTAQLFGGDGFHCSNEKCVTIGCASDDEVEVEVVWPDGTGERFGIVEPGNDYLAIEGESAAFRL